MKLGREAKHSFAIGLITSGFCTELWQFYAAFGLQSLELAKYGVVRSLMSKCVPENETGKMFSAFGILASISPMIFNPLARMIYNKTLDTFPATVIMMCGAVMVLATILNIVLYTQRWRIALFTSKIDKEAKMDPFIQTISLNDNHKVQQI